jgi:hypothetical protein
MLAEVQSIRRMRTRKKGGFAACGLAPAKRRFRPCYSALRRCLNREAFIAAGVAPFHAAQIAGDASASPEAIGQTAGDPRPAMEWNG